MSGSLQSVYLNPTNLKASQVKMVPTGVAVFRKKHDDHKHQYPVSMCEVMPNPAELALYDVVGVLCSTFHDTDLQTPNKMYNVAINLSTNVTLTLDDPITGKINFGEKIYLVRKENAEGIIPKGVYVATPKQSPTSIFVGRIVQEYNRNPQRQITVNLAIE